MPLFKSNEFKGIGFNYDPASQPFFKALVKENLRLLNALPTGKSILKAIKDAKPAYREKSFVKGVNVMLQPPLTRSWNTPGLSAQRGVITDQAKFDAFQGTAENDFQDRKGKLIPGMSSKTQVQECNKPNASNGGGSVCWLYYSNNEMLSDSGEWFIPHITMGHELIHCVHGLYGQMDPDNRQEEYATVGIKGYEGNVLTENKLRQDAGYPPRLKYFADD